MNNEYDKLKQEINRFIVLIEHYEEALIGLPNALNNLFEVKEVDNPEVNEVRQNVRLVLKDKDNVESIVKTMKSNVILMLYNFVEATVRTSIYDYYDRLNRKQLSFSQTIDSIQRLWTKNYLATVRDNQLTSEVFCMIKNAIDSEYKIEIEKESFSLSGNADVRELKNILSNHGVNYDDQKFSAYGGSLLTIKNKRNSLAHGNISFEDNGRSFSIQEIIHLRNNTYDCLDYFISLIDNEYC